MLALAACALVASSPRRALAQAPGAQGVDALEGKPIQAIRFDGDFRSSESFLREQVRSKVGDPFSFTVLDDDVKRLYGRVAGDLRAYPIAVEGGVEIRFFVNEQPLVRDLYYPGLDSLEIDDLNKASAPRGGLRLRRGRHYEEHRANLDERLLIELLEAKGYFFAEVDREVTPAGAGQVDVFFQVREGPRTRVQTIEFSGNVHGEDDTLHRLMRTQTHVLYIIRAGYFQRSALDEDIERLMAWYRGEGFLDVRVYLDDISFNEDRSRVNLQVQVDEGPRYTIRSVAIAGKPGVFTGEALKRDIETQPGDFFDGLGLQRDLIAIQKRYADRGYSFARATQRHKVAADGHQVDVTFTLFEGQPVTIEQVVIEGNWKTRDDVIRREISLKPGDLFNAEELDQSRARVGRARLFKDLAVSFEKGTAKDLYDMHVRVEEADDTGQILFGGGVSTSSGFFGRVAYIQRNFDLMSPPTSWADFAKGHWFAGGGQTLSITAEPGSQRSTYRLAFTEPYLLADYVPIPIQFRTSFSYADSVLARSFTETRLEWTAGLGYRVTRDSLLELGYRVTRTRIFDLDVDAPADVIEVADKNLVSAISLGFRWNKNRIDQNLLAYAGYAFEVFGEAAGGPLGGDHDFWRLDFDANWQTTLFQFPGTSRHVISLRGNAGIMGDYGRSDSVPIFERFFAGGPRSVRGFQVRSVGPQADDEPIGGNVRVTGTAEYSFPIIPGFDQTYAPQWRGDFLRGVAFIDVGNVEPRFNDFTTDDFRVAWGLGLRIKLPVFPAPLALDFAFPLQLKDGDDEEVFSLSVGSSF
jgi:outer membrane protein insertion porin family